MTGPTANTAAAARSAIEESGSTETADLGAPLYVAWQVTNECNLACLHCIEESGPGKAFRDELDEEQIFDILGQFMDLEVPYLTFSGGEPMSTRCFSRWWNRLFSRRLAQDRD